MPNRDEPEKMDGWTDGWSSATQRVRGDAGPVSCAIGNAV